MPKKLPFYFLLITYILLLFLLPSPVLAATLSLSPASDSFAKGCTFAVDVMLDTAGVETDGSDVILQYDPLQVTASAIAAGPIYSDFPGNTIDNSSGKVSIFALAPAATGFNGRGKIATVSFTTSASSSASLAAVNFDFDPNNLTKTTDSNVIQRSDLTDVLSSASGGNYTIDLAQTNCKAVAKAVTTIGLGGPAETLPQSGTAEITWMVGGLGIFFILLSVLGFQLSDKSLSVFSRSVADKQKTGKPNSDNR